MLGRVQGHLDSLLQKMIPLEGGLVCVKSQNSCCPTPTFLGSEDALPTTGIGGVERSQQLGPHVGTACH